MSCFFVIWECQFLFMSSKNFGRETTVTPCCKRNNETLLSNLISSSLVTRYFACPLAAVSMTRLSSLSRQIAISPETKTSSALCSKSSRSPLISSPVISYLLCILGRARTSASSSSIGAEMTTLKTPSSKDFLNLAGKPDGLIKEDTQMLVSITALTATLCFSYFFYGLGNVRFNLFRRKLRCFFVYFLFDLVKLFLPLIMSEYFYCNLFM